VGSPARTPAPSGVSSSTSCGRRRAHRLRVNSARSSIGAAAAGISTRSSSPPWRNTTSPPRKTVVPYFGELDRECIALDHSKPGIDGAESTEVMNVRPPPGGVPRATSPGINSFRARRFRSSVKGSISERFSNRFLRQIMPEKSWADDSLACGSGLRLHQVGEQPSHQARRQHQADQNSDSP
jgi:hypothetical protein